MVEDFSVLSERPKTAKLAPLPNCVNSRTVGLKTRSRTVLLGTLDTASRAQEMMLTSSHSVGQSTLNSRSQNI